MNIDKVFEDSVDPISTKIRARKDLNRIISEVTRKFKGKPNEVDRKHLVYLKDLVSYKGMYLTPLEKDASSDYTDKMTKIFAKLFELIDIVRTYDMSYLLREYIEALEENGVHLTFDEVDKMYSEDDLKEIKDSVYEMQAHQTRICESADIVKLKLGPLAEEEDFSKASEFPSYAKMYYDKEILEKDLTEKTNKLIEKLDKTKEAIEYVLS